MTQVERNFSLYGEAKSQHRQTWKKSQMSSLAFFLLSHHVFTAAPNVHEWRYGPTNGLSLMTRNTIM